VLFRSRHLGRARVRSPRRGRPGRAALGAGPVEGPRAGTAGPDRPMRRVRLLAGLALGLLAALALPAGPASAHAGLVRTQPVQGSVVPDAPAEVVITFTEHVTLVPGKIQVIGPDGKRVDRGTPSVLGSEVRVPVRTDV